MNDDLTTTAAQIEELLRQFASPSLAAIHEIALATVLIAQALRPTDPARRAEFDARLRMAMHSLPAERTIARELLRSVIE